MVLIVSKRELLKHSKVGSIILLLFIILFYVLPKLFNLFWEYNQEPKLDNQHQLWERPLRVERGFQPSFNSS